MKRNKRLALFLALAVTCSLVVPPVSAAEGHWYDKALETWMDRGVVIGDASGDPRPQDNITRAETAVILDRVMDYQMVSGDLFSDVEPGSWYAEAVGKAAAAGIMKGDGTTVRPGEAITRQEAAVMIARVLELEGGAASEGFLDQGAIASWAVSAVNAMAARGYVQGSDGLFRPADPITRAELLTILDNVFTGYFAESGTYTEPVDGSAVISADGVTLEGIHISGDLIVAEGVADGHIVLRDVTLDGRLIVRGGGENSIVISGKSKIGTVLVSRQGGKVRVSVEDGASVSVVYVDDGSDSVKLEGTVDTVTVACPGAALEVTGTVKNLDLTKDAQGVSLTVAKGAKVTTLTSAAPESTLSVSGTVEKVAVEATAASTTLTVEKGAEIAKITTAADHVTVAGSGKVKSLVVTAGTGVSVSKETSVTKVENKSDSPVKVGDKEIAGGESVGNAPSSGGSGGSGGGGGGGTSQATDVVTKSLFFGSSQSHFTVSSEYYDKGVYTLGITAAAVPSGVYNLGLTPSARPDCGLHGAPDEVYTQSRLNGAAFTAARLSGILPAGAVTVREENPALALYRASTVQENAYAADQHGGDYVFLIGEGKSTVTLTVRPENGAAITYAFSFDAAFQAEKPAVKYTVTFNSNGGSAVQAMSVAENETIVRPADPAKTGFAFEGWYKDSGLTQKWNFDTDTVNQALTLYAKWTTSFYTVKFVTNGGSAVTDQNVAHGSAITKPAAPTKQDRAFDGWYKDSGLNEAWDFESAITGPVTLYAKWGDVAAKIGGTNYTSLPAALAAARTGETVTLAADAALGEAVTVGSGVILEIPAENKLISTAAITNGGTILVKGLLSGPVKGGTIDRQGGAAFDGGTGTQADPFQIKTAAQLSDILPGTSADDLRYYLLTDDLDLRESTDSGANLLKNAVFDGGNHKVYCSDGELHKLYGVFRYTLGKAVIRNLTYDMSNLDSQDYHGDSVALVYACYGTDNLIEKVTVTGKHQGLTGNCAAFVAMEFMPGTATLKFSDCTYAAEMQGNSYNGCFIGWQGQYYESQNEQGNVVQTDCEGHITFDHCAVTGKLITEKASIFTANASFTNMRTYTFTDNTIGPDAEIRGTLTANFFAGSAKPAGDAEERAKASFTGLDTVHPQVFVGATDATLAISRGADGALTITASDNAANIDHYVVEVGLYTTLYNERGKNGTWVFSVSETVRPDNGSLSVSLKELGFVDADYQGLTDETTDSLGHLVGTLNGATYYVVKDYIDSDGNQGYVGAPDEPGTRNASIIRVSAFQADGTMYSSALLK